TIFSDRLDLFTDKENKNLVRVVATGNVRFKKDEMSGTSEKAIYEELEKKITLLGNPVIKKADSVIKGSKIVYFQEDESIVAESDSASPQVEVILFPEQLKQMDEGSKKSIGK
ncbi:MAG: LptA/OstA family protein, partial [Nitrospinota bacterium]